MTPLKHELFPSFQVVNLDRSGVVNLSRYQVVSLNRSGVVNFTGFCSKDGKGNFVELAIGIQRLSSFIFSESYHLENAILHASKAAYLAALILYEAQSVEKFKDPLAIKEWIIKEPMNTKLNKFKKSNPEAFFYWYKIFELSRQSK